MSAVDRLVLKMGEVVVPPHQRLGTPVAGYTYWRQGGAQKVASALGKAARTSALERLKSEGGFTINAVSGAAPGGGKVVALPQYEGVFEADEDLVPNIANWVQKNEKPLKQPGANIGGWFDTQTGSVYMDVSIVVKTDEEAKALGKKNDQKAYFDLDKGDEVRLARKRARMIGLLFPPDTKAEDIVKALHEAASK